MDIGKFSLSLSVKDIKKSREFYETLGFQVMDGNEADNWLILRFDNIVIGLFQGMFPKNTLTFVPQDVRAVQRKLKEAGIELLSEAEGTEGAASITLTDPDGNPILFDQHPADYKPRVPEPSGKIAWVDLTVPDAESVRDFYETIIGWESAAVSMGEYDDYNMLRGGRPTTGICHQQGVNQNIPAQWMVYFTVSDYDQSLANVTKLGGEVLVPTRGEKGQRFAVIADPTGAVCALYEQG